MAVWSHCPGPSSNMGPGGRRFIAIVRSKEPSMRALEVLGQLQRTWAWDQNLWQIGHALTSGSQEPVAIDLFSPCHRRSQNVRRAWTRFRKDCVRCIPLEGPIAG